MNYIVTLRDGSKHKLDEQDGTSLKNKWETSRQAFPATLGDDTVLSSQIISITKEQVTEADWLSDVVEASKRIEAKDRCRGQYSIHWQIAMIAHEVSRVKCPENPQGLKWSQLVRDKAWKEMTRLRLRQIQPDGWCDYMAGECACEPEYLSTKARHKPE